MDPIIPVASCTCSSTAFVVQLVKKKDKYGVMCLAVEQVTCEDDIDGEWLTFYAPLVKEWYYKESLKWENMTQESRKDLECWLFDQELSKG